MKHTSFAVNRGRFEDRLALLIRLFKAAPSLEELVRIHCGSCSELCHVKRDGDSQSQIFASVETGNIQHWEVVKILNSPNDNCRGDNFLTFMDSILIIC